MLREYYEYEKDPHAFHLESVRRIKQAETVGQAMDVVLTRGRPLDDMLDVLMPELQNVLDKKPSVFQDVPVRIYSEEESVPAAFALTLGLKTGGKCDLANRKEMTRVAVGFMQLLKAQWEKSPSTKSVEDEKNWLLYLDDHFYIFELMRASKHQWHIINRNDFPKYCYGRNVEGKDDTVHIVELFHIPEDKRTDFQNDDNTLIHELVHTFYHMKYGFPDKPKQEILDLFNKYGLPFLPFFNNSEYGADDAMAENMIENIALEIRLNRKDEQEYQDEKRAFAVQRGHNMLVEFFNLIREEYGLPPLPKVKMTPPPDAPEQFQRLANEVD